MNMKVRKLAVVILAKERESCRELFEGITLGCSNERIKPAEIISTFLCPCSVEQFEYILNNDDCCPNFAEYFAGAEYRLIIAADTEAQDFLETLRGVVAHSAFRYDQTMQILSLSDVVADACHARGITNICIQRTDSGATDLRLEQRLPDKLIRPYAVTGAINQDLRQLRDDALQQEKDKRRDAPVFDAFWNAWRMVLLGTDVGMVLLDHYQFPSEQTRPPYVSDFCVMNTTDLYIEAVADWIRAHAAVVK